MPIDSVKKPPKSLPFVILAFVALCAWRLWPGSPGAWSTTYQFNGQIFGTTYIVKIVSPELDSQQREQVETTLAATLRQVDMQMSTYRPDSELSRFNKHQQTTAFSVADDTFEVFELARDISERSGGAFDITVGPLVNAWGFGPGEARTDLSEEELTRLRDRVGYQLVNLDTSTHSVQKKYPDIYCDLSAIAKGFAVDRVSEELTRLGHTNFMVEIGGEIRTSGTNQGESLWRLAVERPNPGTRSIHSVVELTNLAMATSGDYRNFYMKDGRRYSHTIDPRTGRPIDHSLASVTVIHPSCAFADAMATALNVLGPEAGIDLARSEKLAAFFLIRSNQGEFIEKSTPAFDALRASIKKKQE